MKILRLSLLPAFLALAAPAAFAQFATPAYEPLKIDQTVSAVFPQEALTDGLRTGTARVSIQIDADGKLSDYLVTLYSHPKFADSALEAIKRWHYRPARIHGNPRSATADLKFNFETSGVVVVDMTVLTGPELFRFKIVPNANAYSACTLSQLDRTPTPVKIVKPVYPEKLARSSRGGHVTVEFYIDQQGHVRLPSVDQQTIEANEELAALAVTAVEQWQFDPPTMNGRPVLTLAQQDFDFKPAP
ncbi:MAG TPA: TonB family protein [Opitutaceae bacterium]|jgi:TonB family protein